MGNTTEDVLRASSIFNRANMHLPPALCIHFVIVSISPFSSQLLGEICSNKNCPGCLDSLESRAGWYAAHPEWFLTVICYFLVSGCLVCSLKMCKKYIQEST